MNREMLFRGKSIGTDEWLYGNLFNYGLTAPSNVPCISVCVPTSWEEAYNLYAVHPDTIGQYTGLKDKNGKKIFEGDIISYYTTETYCINPNCDLALQGYGSKLVKKEHEVKYIDDCFCVDDETCRPLPISYCGIQSEEFDEFKATVDHEPYFDTNGYKLDGSIIGIEIIGNVTDNPELMK